MIAIDSITVKNYIKQKNRKQTQIISGFKCFASLGVNIKHLTPEMLSKIK